VTSILALRFPVAAGVNVTVMWQVAPEADVAGESGQVLVWAKSSGSAPATLMLATPNCVPLGLPITIVCALLFVPTGSFPKANTVSVLFNLPVVSIYPHTVLRRHQAGWLGGTLRGRGGKFVACQTANSRLWGLRLAERWPPHHGQ
jgi:hypothetical protein